MVGEHDEVGDQGRVDLRGVARVGREGPRVGLRGAPRERPGREGHVHLQLRRQPAPEQQRAVDEQHPTRRQVHALGPRGPVGLDVPQPGQDGTAPRGRGEDLADQRPGVEPVVVERVRVGAPPLEAQRRRAQEVPRRHPQHRAREPAQPLDEPVGPSVGPRGRGAVEQDPGRSDGRAPLRCVSWPSLGTPPRVHLLGEQVEQGVGAQRSDRRAGHRRPGSHSRRPRLPLRPARPARPRPAPTRPP